MLFRSEQDAPNFCFSAQPCSWYSGTKAEGEKLLGMFPDKYVWRLRIPFDEYDNSRNYLSKIMRYDTLLNATNSVSHRGDFVKACLDLYQKRAAYGIYNVTNPGPVTTEGVVQQIKSILKPAKQFNFWASDEEFYKYAAKTLRSNCVLNTSKLAAAGIKLRTAEEAIHASLINWKPE